MIHYRIAVDPVPWSESENSWYLLTKRVGTTWSEGRWFPKSACTLRRDEGYIVLSKWLYDRMFAKGYKPEFIIIN